MDTSNREQQINVVDETTLQAVLSSMTGPEVHAFLEELHKTGKACKSNVKLSNETVSSIT